MLTNPSEISDFNSPFADAWNLKPGVTYLNHGSFGPPPLDVIESQRHWQTELFQQPMDFFVRKYEDAWRAARQSMAEFVGATAENLVFAENATAAMNIVANSFPLDAGDEVLLTDHEYGAVRRIWNRALQQAGGGEVTIARLPLPMTTIDEIVDTVFRAVSEHTRLIVLSHITSPTAVTLPVAEICREAHRREIAICVDGPHAVAQLDLSLDSLECDYYTASCHKWLCAPFGSGFLYVAPRRQHQVQTPMLSWGRIPPNDPTAWSDEFIWTGTRDSSAYLAVPAAIDFLQNVGIATFRDYIHRLARYARSRFSELLDTTPIIPDSPEWYTGMTHLPLPKNTPPDLQQQLWTDHAIEVPVVNWNDQLWLRVSCHLYNTREDIDRLHDALRLIVNR